MEAPGSSRQGLSGKNPDFGPQICKHLALKYANPDNAHTGPEVPNGAPNSGQFCFSVYKWLGHFTLVGTLSSSHHLTFFYFSNHRDAARKHRLQSSSELLKYANCGQGLLEGDSRVGDDQH